MVGDSLCHWFDLITCEVNTEEHILMQPARLQIYSLICFPAEDDSELNARGELFGDLTYSLSEWKACVKSKLHVWRKTETDGKQSRGSQMGTAGCCSFNINLSAD